MEPESAEKLVAWLGSDWFVLVGVGFGVFVIWALGGTSRRNNGDAGGGDGAGFDLFDGSGDNGGESDGGGDGGD